MEKIKITKEQESLLKRYKEKGGDLGMFIRFRHVWMELNPLAIFSPEEFSLLLHGWYEVEQSFEVGDWVFNPESGEYLKIIEIKSGNYMVELSDKEDYNVISSWIDTDYPWGKVTEPWKIKLLELGRERPEFQEGDILVNTEATFEVGDLNTQDDVLFWLQVHKDQKTYIYTVEQRVELKIK